MSAKSHKQIGRLLLQFHSPALFAAVICLSGFVWLNAREQRCLVLKLHEDYAPLCVANGWPLVFHFQSVATLDRIVVPPTPDEKFPVVRVKQQWKAITIDTLCALILITCVGVLVEWITRRVATQLPVKTESESKYAEIKDSHAGPDKEGK